MARGRSVRNASSGAPRVGRRRGLIAGAAALTLAAAALLLYPRPKPVRHVVVVSVDTLRADRLSCYGSKRLSTPQIDRLAREGVLFENAATSTPLTLPAHASFFTGESPLRHGVLDNFGFRLEEKEETLAELARARGFATGGFVGAFVLDSRFGLAQGFDTYFDQFEASGERAAALEANQRPGDRVLAPALDWIRAQGQKPFFAFIHFYDPHTPYAPPEPYRKEHGPTEAGLYDGEVAFVDSLMGKLLAALEEQGVYQDALVVLAADHGESLGEHGETTHGYFIYDATIRVPLIIRAPGFGSGRRVRAQVRTIDILPTILDLIGVPAPAGIEGASLRSLLRHPESDPGRLAYIESHYSRLHFGWAPLRGVRSDRYKFIEAPQRELFDLRADPSETENLIAERSGLVGQLASTLEHLVGPGRARELAPRMADPETEERLRALGYVTASAGRPRATGDPGLSDPKEKIDLFNKVAEARVAAQIGEVERAIALLNSVLQEDPDIELAYLLAGNIRLQGRKFAEAAAVFRASLARNDQSLDGAYGLALAYKGMGRLEEAAAGFERCLRSQDPRQARAAYQLADVRMAQGRAAEAERLLREALRARPDTSLRLVLADTLLAQGIREQALRVLREAENEDGDNFLVHLSLGNLLLENQDVEGALTSYRRAETLAPEEPRVFNAKGNALARQGDGRGSLEAFQKAVELDPAFAPAQNNLGIALARGGRLAEAQRAFRKAIDSDPAYAQAYNNLGYLYLQAGALGQAVPLFRRALALKPDYLQARSNLAAALRRTPRSD